MPRGPEISEFQRGRIVGKYEEGATIRKISKDLEVSKTAVHKIITDYKATGKTSAKKRSGRPGPSKRFLRSIQRTVEDEPGIKLSELAARFEVSETTVGRYLHLLGYYKG
ncbi:hypothetical protein DERF_014316 [Dermatophagoides farinae]|uniref:Uncharacterized protein n=1 Tax=Dermatophagoides farinae TaxID=6954 RepID=A0A922HHI4_DERFA|nr:uncharacterized protein LOC124493899 [Dermatophagoides farinae]KAH7644443.1 hypothetical protein HUG17_6805 [Dermatophagoides farinae]KAH9493578.1 hypothetical protein DERF_014316 [Dermatophagoides farinae]